MAQILWRHSGLDADHGHDEMKEAANRGGLRERQITPAKGLESRFGLTAQRLPASYR
jgi:hypothetical protein